MRKPTGTPDFKKTIGSSDRQNTVTIKRSIRYFLLIALGCLLSCAVPQWKREHLTDPIMRFDEDPDATDMDNRVLPFREGASGAKGGNSGGCGC
jgi:hypothetical protein